ncbi:MAG: LA_3751/LA_3752 family putative glycosyltransferase, partial [Desulfobacterales bacterium]
QFSKNIWRPDMQLPIEPWVQPLWEKGLYPFAPPFVYKNEGKYFIQYPLFFSAISAPFYRWFGFRGLTILPLISTWGLWGFFVAGCRRRGIALSGTALGLTGLIFASTLTLYSAMFSEHTLAVAMSFGGLVLAMPSIRKPQSERMLIISGLLMGCACWLRPESFIFTLGAIISLGRMHIGLSKLVKLGLLFLVPVSGYLFFNLYVYGIPLGLHGVQHVETHQLHYPGMSPIKIFLNLGDSLVYFHPILLLIAGMAATGLLAKGIGQHLGGAPDRNEMMAWIILTIMMVVSVFILPNDGGKQLGPRYWFHLLPLLWFIAAIRFNALLAAKGITARLMAVMCVGFLLIGIWLNTFQRAKTLYADYQTRTLPALQLVSHVNSDVIVVTHQWIAQELQAEMQRTSFVRVTSENELELLVRAMADMDRTRLLWFDYTNKKMEDREYPSAELRFGRPHPIGQYFVSYGLISKY